jgi:cholesterol transport system auxiliary component
MNRTFGRTRRTRGCLIAAAVLLVGACSGPPPQTFDLSAASPPPEHRLRAQIAVREPIASPDLDSQRILVRTGPDTVAYLAGAQWSDRLPALVQSRLVQTFQNARLLRSVARAGSGPAADYSLELDLRAFELDVADAQANVDIAAKIIAVDSGRVVAAKIFKTQTPATGTDGPAAATALNTALTAVMAEIVAFTVAQI